MSSLSNESGATNGRTRRKHPITRSRRGCLTCRGRKVKCDEEEPRCGACCKLALDCRWPVDRYNESSLRSDTSTESRTARGGTSDSMGIRSGSTLSDDLRLPLSAASDEIDQSKRHSVAETLTPSLPETERLLELYMTKIQCNRRIEAFIQKGALLRELKEHGTTSLVVLAICSSAYRFSGMADPSHPDGGIVAARWAKMVLAGIMARINELSEEVLAAALIMIHHERVSGRYIAAWTIVGLVGRMAFAMRLHLDTCTDQLGLAGIETKRRLMWAAFSVDSVFGAGIAEFTSIPAGSIHIPLPIPDHCFNLGIPARARFLHEVARPGCYDPLLPSEDGITARRIRLLVIRQDVLTFGKNIDRFPQKPWEPGSPFDDCLVRLRHWQDTLPASLQLTPGNLYLHHGNHEAGAFVNIHVWHKQLYCDLYRIAFPGFRESASDDYWATAPVGHVQNMRKIGYEAACAVADTFKMAESVLPGEVGVDLDVTVIAYESIRIQLQFLGLEYGLALPPELARIATERFEALVAPLNRLKMHYQSVLRPLRDVNRLLARHGYFIGVHDTSTSATPGDTTPANGPVLSRMHALSRTRPSRAIGDPKESQDILPTPGAVGSNHRAGGEHVVRFDPAPDPRPLSDVALGPFEERDSPAPPDLTAGFNFDQVFDFDSAFGTLDAQTMSADIDPFFPLFQSWTAVGADDNETDGRGL